MPALKKELLNRVMKKVALDLISQSVPTFTICTFDHRGVSKSTVDHRINNNYKLTPTWVLKTPTQWKRVYQVEELVTAMKEKGDWE